MRFEESYEMEIPFALKIILFFLKKISSLFYQVFSSVPIYGEPKMAARQFRLVSLLARTPFMHTDETVFAFGSSQHALHPLEIQCWPFLESKDFVRRLCLIPDRSEMKKGWWRHFASCTWARVGRERDDLTLQSIPQQKVHSVLLFLSIKVGLGADGTFCSSLSLSASMEIGNLGQDAFGKSNKKRGKGRLSSELWSHCPFCPHFIS